MDSHELHFLDKYAINSNREAYEHRVPHEYTKGTVLHVGHFHRIDPGEGETDVTTPLTPTAEEISPVKPAKATDCVWVGMILSREKLTELAADQPKAGKAESPAPKDGEIKDGETAVTSNSGEVRVREKRKAGKNSDLVFYLTDEPDVTAFDPKARRVVFKKTKFYALDNPNQATSLSAGVMIPSTQIFFFRRFRDDEARSFINRGQASISLAQKASIEIELPAHAASSAAQVDIKKEDEMTHASRNLDAAADNAAAASVIDHDLVTDLNANMENGDEHEGAVPMDGDNDGNGDVNMGDVSLNDLVDAQIARETTQGVGLPTSIKSFKGANTQGPNDANCYLPATSSSPIMIHGSSSASELSDLSDDLRVDGLRAYSPLTDNGETVGLGLGISLDKSVSKVPAPFNFNKDGEGQDFAIRQKSKSTVSTVKRKRCHTPDEEGYTADDDNDDQKYSDEIATALKKLIDKLQKRGDSAVLHQIHTLAKCLDGEAAPPNNAALTVALNIPSNITHRYCKHMLAELQDLFPELEDKTEGMTARTLVWMLEGLRVTGSSIDLPMVRPYLIAFNMEVQEQFGNREPMGKELTQGKLIDMICRARDHAEAIFRHRELGNLEAEDD